MPEFSTQSLQRIAQSLEGDYDVQSDVIHSLFRHPSIRGALVDTLTEIPYRLKETSSTVLDQLDTEANTAWLNAVLNFVDELEREGFDVSQINVDDIAQQIKSVYIEELRSELINFFEEWFQKRFEDTVAEEVKSEITSTVLGEVGY